MTLYRFVIIFVCLHIVRNIRTAVHDNVRDNVDLLLISGKCYLLEQTIYQHIFPDCSELIDNRKS